MNSPLLHLHCEHAPDVGPPPAEQPAFCASLRVTSVARLRSFMVSEDGFGFDSHTGTTFTLNETGRFVIARLLADLEPLQIVVAVGETFEVPQAVASRDLETFLRVLARHRLIELETGA